MTYKLISQEENSLQAELALTEVEQVLKTGSQKIQDHCIVIAFGTKPTDEGNTDAAGEGFVDLGFILKLGMLGLDAFEFDGNLLSRDDIDAEVNVA